MAGTSPSADLACLHEAMKVPLANLLLDQLLEQLRMVKA